MKLSAALVACDRNENYLDFFPIVQKAWKDVVQIDCVLVLVAPEVPSSLKFLQKHILLYDEYVTEGIPSLFAAQCIRLLMPALLNVEGAVIISDVDMIPMQKDYFVKNVENVAEDKFVVYRDVMKPSEVQYPICYNAATPTTWQKVFDCTTKAKLTQILKGWYDECVGSDVYSPRPHTSHWNFDQRKLFQIVSNNPCKHIVHNRESESGLFYRLDRSSDTLHNNIPLDVGESISLHRYCDFHMFRTDTHSLVSNCTNHCHLPINRKVFQLLFNKVYVEADEHDLLTFAMISLLQTNGDILEIGTTNDCTPLLHAICRVSKRRLMTLDTSLGKVKEFQLRLGQSHNRAIEHVASLQSVVATKFNSLEDGRRFGAVIIPDWHETSGIDVSACRDKTDLFVIGHSAPPENFLVTFKYRYSSARVSILSNFIDVNLFFLE